MDTGRRTLVGIIAGTIVLGTAGGVPPYMHVSPTTLNQNSEKSPLEKEKDSLFDLLVHTPTSRYYKQTENGSNNAEYNKARAQFAPDYNKLKEDIIENIDIPRSINGRPNSNEGLMLGQMQSISNRVNPGMNVYSDISEVLYFTSLGLFQRSYMATDQLSLVLFKLMLKAARSFSNDYEQNKAANRLERGLTEEIYDEVGLLIKFLLKPNPRLKNIPYNNRISYIIDCVQTGREIAVANHFQDLVSMYDELGKNLPKKLQ